MTLIAAGALLIFSSSAMPVTATVLSMVATSESLMFTVRAALVTAMPSTRAGLKPIRVAFTAYDPALRLTKR